MAVRLRPQSSAWLAPTALAAQLTAQTGQIAGQGVAGLLGGIAQGVGAFTQKREQRRVEAINESRYQDSLRMRQADDARQDQRFQYGAVQDQMALNKDFKVGAELAYALDPTPENLMKVQQAESNNKALSAALAKYSGVQMPEMAQAPQGAPTGEIPPMPAAPQAPGMKERLEKVAGFESLSDSELSTVTESLATDLKLMDDDVDAVREVSKVKAAERMAANKTERGRLAFDLALATSVLKRREAKAKVAQTEEEAAARARGTASVTGPADAAADAATVANLNDDAKAQGWTGAPFKTKDAALKWLEGNKQVTVAKTKDTEITDPNKSLAFERAKEMAQIRNTYSLGRIAEVEQMRKRLIDYAAANGKSDDPEFKMLNTMRDNAVDSARSLYAAADNGSINKTAADALMKQADAEIARVKEFDKKMAMVFEGAPARAAATPAPAGAAVPKPTGGGKSLAEMIEEAFK